MLSLTDLETRIEQATAPSRLLDLRIELLFRVTSIGWGRGDDFGYTMYADACAWSNDQLAEAAASLTSVHPAYTKSMDACLKLMDYVLPEWFWRGGRVPHAHWLGRRTVHGWAHLSRTHADHCDHKDEATGWAETPELAFCLAIVRGAKHRPRYALASVTSGGDGP